GDPEIFDPVSEAERVLQRGSANGIGAKEQLMPVEVREEVEGGVARQRAALVGAEAYQHLVEQAGIVRGKENRDTDEQHAERSDHREQRGATATEEVE